MKTVEIRAGHTGKTRQKTKTTDQPKNVTEKNPEPFIPTFRIPSFFPLIDAQLRLQQDAADGQTPRTSTSRQKSPARAARHKTWDHHHSRGTQIRLRRSFSLPHHHPQVRGRARPVASPLRGSGARAARSDQMEDVTPARAALAEQAAVERRCAVSWVMS